MHPRARVRQVESQTQAQDHAPLSKMLRPQLSSLRYPRRMAGHPWQAILPRGPSSGEERQLLTAQAGRPKILRLLECGGPFSRKHFLVLPTPSLLFPVAFLGAPVSPVWLEGRVI